VQAMPLSQSQPAPLPASQGAQPQPVVPPVQDGPLPVQP
jgi:general secretion pathway protein D